jgi:hypothetical protein
MGSILPSNYCSSRLSLSSVTTRFRADRLFMQSTDRAPGFKSFFLNEILGHSHRWFHLALCFQDYPRISLHFDYQDCWLPPLLVV